VFGGTQIYKKNIRNLGSSRHPQNSRPKNIKISVRFWATSRLDREKPRTATGYIVNLNREKALQIACAIISVGRHRPTCAFNLVNLQTA